MPSSIGCRHRKWQTATVSTLRRSVLMHIAIRFQVSENMGRPTIPKVTLTSSDVPTYYPTKTIIP